VLADEEDGSIGATWMAENGRHLLRDAQYLINEGATLVAQDGAVRHVGVATMEKSVLWLRLSATGQAGHGSTPGGTGALDRLLAALERVRADPRPIRLLPSVAAYFAGIAAGLPDDLRAAAQLRDHLADGPFLARLTADPRHNALLRDTVAVTGVHAGDKVNVIPGTAQATLDCRLLPGTDKAEFLAWLRRTLADDQIAIEELLFFATEESPIDTGLMRSIRRVAARMHPGAPVFPVPLTSTTDSSVFRSMGITSYGFEPWVLTEEELLLTHGADERISVENLEHGLRFLYGVIEGLDRE